MPLLSAWSTLLERRYGLASGADELHRVRCADGVVVTAKRFRPRAVDAALLPVVCLPGLGTDSHNFDAPAPWGLARVLADAGHDTWPIDLRGTGQSTLSFSRWVGVTFDDFAGLDLPAVVDHVLATTGAPQVALVGHSMGGLVAYAALSSGMGSKIAAAVTLGSPLGFPRGLAVAPFLRPLLPLAPLAPGLFGGALGRAVAPFLLRGDTPYLKNWLILEHVDGRAMRRVMYRAVQDVPRGVMFQFKDWLEHDVFRSKDAAVDYRARLHGVATPVLVVEAPRDGLADVAAVRRALSLLPAAEHFVAGRAGGCSVDYGHIDVLFGRDAPVDVHPRLVSFLARAARRPQALRRAA
ncbi:MAG: alpha/beta hydrolase [Deltaproteobacteria bacterium]|nr:alpha/beta hydrolase [Deltaproteobacteria bacterium]